MNCCEKLSRNKALFVVFTLLLALDVATKAFFANWLRLGQSVEIIPGFFSFTLVHNRGAAFGMGSDWSTPFFLITTFLAMGVVIYLFTHIKAWEYRSRIGLVMILSGAVGNLIDRIRLGYVVDFLNVYYQQYHWPVFNIADSAITIGAILFALDSFFPPRPASESSESADQA